MLSFFLKDYGKQDLFIIDCIDEDFYMARRVHEAFMADGYFISLSCIYMKVGLFKRLGLFGDDVI